MFLRNIKRGEKKKKKKKKRRGITEKKRAENVVLCRENVRVNNFLEQHVQKSSIFTFLIL
jgi:hypothetical protein